MQRLAFLLALLAFLLAGFALFKAPSPQSSENVEPEGAHELVYQMGYMQTYAAKMGEAGSRENWPLAGFYVHELEETAEEIVEAGYVDNGVSLTELAEATLIPAIERLDEAVDRGDSDAFAKAYEGLIATCNGCHTATAHPFLVMRTTADSGFPGQSFERVGE